MQRTMHQIQRNSPGNCTNRKRLTDDTRATARVSIAVHAAFHATAFSTMVRITRGAVTHQHAGSGGSLEHIVDTFDAEGTTFFVVPSADIVGNTFSLRSRHVVQVVWVVLCRPEVRLASDKDDRNDRSTNGPHLFNPLQVVRSERPTSWRARLKYLDRHVLQRI